MKIKILIVVSALTLGLAAPAHAGSFEGCSAKILTNAIKDLSKIIRPIVKLCKKDTTGGVEGTVTADLDMDGDDYPNNGDTDDVTQYIKVNHGDVVAKLEKRINKANARIEKTAAKGACGSYYDSPTNGGDDDGQVADDVLNIGSDLAALTAGLWISLCNNIP